MTMIVHIFKCEGDGNRYGFTQDLSGANLPKDMCVGGWKFWKTRNFEKDKPVMGVEVNAVLNILARDGFAVQDATLNFLNGEV